MHTNGRHWMAAVALIGLVHMSNALAQPEPTSPGATATAGGDTVDLGAPEYNPPDCPAWAKEKLPDWLAPHRGYHGLPAKWRPAKRVFGAAVKGLDRYQANQFIFCSLATTKYLYEDYTSLTVNYVAGTLPTYEKVAAQYTAGCATATTKAVALLTKAMPAVCRHPTMPLLGPGVRADRNLDDEALLASGCGFCNEQARVFIRLCQVCGIPARMIHLWGQNHTVAEFYADGRWALADATNLFVAPGKDGKLLSAAQCHDGAAGQRLYAEAKQRRLREMAGLSDAQLGFTDPDRARQWREEAAKPIVDELATREVGFGVINYPLPPVRE